VIMPQVLPVVFFGLAWLYNYFPVKLNISHYFYRFLYDGKNFVF